MTSYIQYSVIVPVFNSEQSLEELFSGIQQVFADMGATFEVIFVDDCSPDGSWAVLERLKKQFPDTVTAIRLSKNFGQHNATICGMGFAKGEFVITIDDDLQVPPAEIRKLIAAREPDEAELVYGRFERKRHSITRNIGSRGLKTSSKLLHGSKGEGSSFRLISRSLADKILKHQHNFIFLDEILQWYTDDISFTPVVHLPRKYKQSGYTFRKLIYMITNILMYYTLVPLKFLVYGGLIFSLITFAFGMFQIIKKLVFNVPLGYTSLIVAILFSTSIILFSLGIIGEYLRRIYQSQNMKPPFSISKIF
jgi:undecaprenyl-phosphate 4-deoxy-4-formamido-L-arabinose transferase